MPSSNVSDRPISGMAWLAGLGPNLLGFQWYFAPELWSVLNAEDPHGTLVLVLRRDGMSLAICGALYFLERQPAGFRQIGVAPGTYRGELGWLSRSGKLIRVLAAGPASPLPTTEAPDRSLVLARPMIAVSTQCRPDDPPAHVPAVAWIDGACNFERVDVGPAVICKDRNPDFSETSFTVVASTDVSVSLGVPIALDESPPSRCCEAWRASGAHTLPPDVGWPPSMPQNPVDVA